MTKEVNLLGVLHPAARALELGLWNRVVPDDRLAAEVDTLVEVLLSKNQQAAQGFEALSAGLTGAVNGSWEVPDADAGAGVLAFTDKGSLWQHRRGLARDFWSDGGSR